MASITQEGNNNQASTGDNSPNIKGNKNTVISNREKSKWFIFGILLPVISGLLVEFLKQGKVSELLSAILNFFK